MTVTVKTDLGPHSLSSIFASLAIPFTCTAKSSDAGPSSLSSIHDDGWTRLELPLSIKKNTSTVDLFKTVLPAVTAAATSHLPCPVWAQGNPPLSHHFLTFFSIY